MRSSNETNLNIADISALPSVNGSPIPATQMLSLSVQVIMTGTSPTGIVKVQASNDPGNPVNGGSDPTNWTDISGAYVSVSAATTYLIPKLETTYAWVRLVYTQTSGTGTCVANVFSQGL